MSEAEFQTAVIDAARILGWRCSHIRPMWDKTGKRMLTPYTGDTGLPDLIMARRGVVLLAELKTDIGSIKLDQQAWVDAAGPQGYVWRPRDWPQVLQILQSR